MRLWQLFAFLRSSALPETPSRGRAVILLAWLRAVLVLAALSYGGWLLLTTVNRFSPVRDWLIWRLLVFWAWDALLVGGCLVLGDWICRRLLRRYDEWPGVEAMVLAMAVGVEGFVVIMYAAGAAHLFHPVFAVALPVALLVGGAVFSPLPRRCLAWVRGARWQLSPFQVLLLAFGVVAAGLAYLQILEPGAPNHDAHWTHVVIAQDFAREGRLVQFRADWAKNFPHLASIIYTWVFLVPWMDLPMRMGLVMHTEFVLLLWTLAGVVAATRWLTSDHDGHNLAWIVLFLFPNIYIYDSRLGASADHVAAFFALPLCLAMARAAEGLALGEWAIAGVVMGAALITKVQITYLAIPLSVMLGARWAIKVVGRLRQKTGAPPPRQLAAAPVALVGCTMLAASPFLLENTVFHHNPVYPFMQSVFRHSTPTLPDAAELVSKVLTPSWLQGPAETLPRVKEALKLVFTFSFEPHYSFADNWPYFGFLFTLLSPLALILPKARRLRAGALVGAGAVFVWAMTYLVDRNLQIILPALVAVTAGVMVRVWQMGVLARAALICVVAAQALWAAEPMMSALRGELAQARQGLAGHVDIRETQSRRAMTKVLPPDAVVLLHAQLVSLGLDREVLRDWAGMQALVDYRTLRTAREVYDRYRAIGVTHVAWVWGDRTSSRQEEIVFAVFAKLYASHMGTYGRAELAAVPTSPPPVESPYRVLALGVNGYADGIYSIEQMGACEPMAGVRFPAPQVRREDLWSMENALSEVDVVMLTPAHQADPAISMFLSRDFEAVRATPPYTLFLNRKRVVQARSRAGQ